MFQAYAKAADRQVRQLPKDRSGSVVMLFGLFGSLAFLTAGGAVDYGRWMHARYHTARALDAAVLAGGRALQMNQANPNAAVVHAKNVYDSNVSGRLALKNDTIQFEVVDGNMGITAKGRADIATTILGIVGISELPVAGTAGAKFPKAKLASGGGGSSNMEIALMLDVTSSMCVDSVGPCWTDTKIQGLKDAANELVNIVVQADQSKFTSRVALVPFSTSVRVGPDGGGGALMTTLTGLPATKTYFESVCTQWTGDWGTYDNETGVTTGATATCTGWQTVSLPNQKVIPCVTDRMFNSSPNYNYTDVPPGSGHWLNANDGSRWPLADDAADAPVSGGSGASAATPARQWNYNSDGSCWESAEANEVMPLSSDKTALKARIDGLRAYGSTSGALGTAFAWYMLSPDWQNIWPNASRPGGYSDLTNIQSNGRPKLRKVAVLMTDGGYNTYRGWKGRDQQAVSDHAAKLCEEMKLKNIEVFTIGFALNELPLGEQTIARKTLSDCGTDVSHFYETLTVDELKVAFKEIAMSMTTVFLSE
jgi:Putative Flp pilus-assembly TadE/G-like